MFYFIIQYYSNLNIASVVLCLYAIFLFMKDLLTRKK